MKKDIILALLAGFLIGSLVALLAVKLPQMLDKSSSNTVANTDNNNSPTPITVKTNILEISAPKDNSILDSSEIKISGKTLKGAKIIIETALNSEVIEASQDGSFVSTQKAVEGGNQIIITAIDESNIEESKTLTLFYTAEEL